MLSYYSVLCLFCIKWFLTDHEDISWIEDTCKKLKNSGKEGGLIWEEFE